MSRHKFVVPSHAYAAVCGMAEKAGPGETGDSAMALIKRSELLKEQVSFFSGVLQ